MSNVLAPYAWTTFVLAYPWDGGVHAGDVTTYEDAEQVNALVNTHIQPSTDPLPAVVDERWLILLDDSQPQFGWCHDYAVSKRHALLKKRWPSAKLILAHCVTAEGENHLVLIADGYVLDNRRDHPVLPRQTGYKWIRQQSPENPDLWVTA